MIYTRFENRYGTRWAREGSAAVTGHLLYEGRMYEGERLASLIALPEFRAGWPESLKEVGGFFAIVYQQDGSLWAATDRVRGFPLFYAQKGKDFYISDDAGWVRRQIGESVMDELAVAEFLQASYVTGRDTLFPSLKQIQAGEAIRASQEPSGFAICRDRYFRHMHRDFFQDTPEELIDRMDVIYEKLFKRFVEWANGRTVVIPLTGGYDSRCVALMLHRLKYDNVLCYTCGGPGLWDISFAEDVASRLGFRWKGSYYSNEQWAEWYPSPERVAYGRFAYNFTSLHHMLEWPGVWELSKEGYFPDDSIFVPGHTAIAACHTPKLLQGEGRIGMGKVIRALLQYKYYHQRASGLGNDKRPLIAEKIESLIGDLPADTAEDAANAYECWEWQERQAKLQVNAVRVYEYWGYQWSLPLWDVEATDFWLRVPSALRTGKWVYGRYINGIGQEFGLPVAIDQRTWYGKLKGMLNKLGLEKLARGYLNRRMKPTQPLRVYGSVPDEKWHGVEGEMAPATTYWINEALEEMREAARPS